MLGFPIFQAPVLMVNEYKNRSTTFLNHESRPSLGRQTKRQISDVTHSSFFLSLVQSAQPFNCISFWKKCDKIVCVFSLMLKPWEEGEILTNAIWYKPRVFTVNWNIRVKWRLPVFYVCHWWKQEIGVMYSLVCESEGVWKVSQITLMSREGNFTSWGSDE